VSAGRLQSLSVQDGQIPVAARNDRFAWTELFDLRNITIIIIVIIVIIITLTVIVIIIIIIIIVIIDIIIIYGKWHDKSILLHLHARRKAIKARTLLDFVDIGSYLCFS
jgi:hypothetical protein